jgi:D-alanyl-D-alanine carboxypeptidase (penicillin-binding protein 5/6)
MTRFLRTTCIGFLMGLLGVLHVQAQVVPQPPEIAARAYLLVDVTAQQTLAELDADKPIEPASLTKLMTAYIVFDALKAKKSPCNKPSA